MLSFDYLLITRSKNALDSDTAPSAAYLRVVESDKDFFSAVHTSASIECKARIQFRRLDVNCSLSESSQRCIDFWDSALREHISPIRQNLISPPSSVLGADCEHSNGTCCYKRLFSLLHERRSIRGILHAKGWPNINLIPSAKKQPGHF